MNERRWFLACAIVVLAACGDPDPVTPVDGGGTPEDGGGETPDGGGPTPPPLAMASTDGDDTNGSEAPADFACVGTATAPTPGAEIEYTAHFYDFLSSSTDVTSTPVEIFTTNLVTSGCTAPGCASYTTDAMGDATITTPADGWIAYRTAASEDYVATIGYNRAAPGAASETLALPVVALSTLNLIPGLFMRTRVPGTGVVSGNLSDCDGNPVEGAQLRLFRGATELVPGTAMTDFFVGYFNAATGLPSRTATWTDSDGIYASANVATGAEPVRVELWAVTTEGAAPVRVACEAIEVAADAISIISAGPTRSDYPAGHPCE